MMQGRIGPIPLAAENPLGLSWHDSAWIPMLNPSNIMDYFSERSNPFFDRTCNNEIVKMQRLSPDQLTNMTGLEYILLHVQEPILYVIRKQHRHSSTQVTPLADYYIIAGIVYQAPDLASVLNSRILSAVHHLQSSFEEATSYSRYHPSKGYSWDFKPNKPGMPGNIIANPSTAQNGTSKESTSPPKEEPSTLFQRQRVDMLLAELVRQFPIPVASQPATDKAVPAITNAPNENGTETKPDVKPSTESLPPVTIKQEPVETNGPGTPLSNGVGNGPSSGGGNNVVGGQQEIKQEMKPPPEKKPRMN